MNHIQIQRVLASSLIIVICISCRSTRSISKVISVRDTTKTVCLTKQDSMKVNDVTIKNILTQLNRNIITFQFFTAKMKVNYENSNTKDANFTANIRIQKDSIIWISLTGAFGIEGYRLFITPTSMQLMDKLHKTIQTLPIEHLQNITQIPLDFKTLQNLIIGNPIFIDSNVTSCTEYNNQLLVTMVGTFFKQTITMDKPNHRIVQSKLDDIDNQGNRTCNILNEAFETKNNQWFPTERNVTILGKNQVSITINTKSFTIDEAINFPFNIPKNYTRKS